MLMAVYGEEAVKDTKQIALGNTTADCHWHEWSDWDECPPPTTCQGQRRIYTTRTRTLHKEQYGGKSCRGSATETKECPTTPRVVGTWQNWESWSDCSTSCSGVQTRTRNCTEPTLCFTPCRGEYVEWRSCGSPDLCCVPREWTRWGAWTSWVTEKPSSSPRHSLVGTRKRYRTCDGSPRRRGEVLCPAPCPGESLDTERCKESVWATWGAWSDCVGSSGRVDADRKVPCGDDGGRRERNRTCRNGTCQGSCKGDKSQSVTCDLKPCCEDPTWSKWCDWGQCDDRGRQTRERLCSTDPNKWSAPTCRSRRCVGQSSESQNCDPYTCVPKQWASWDDWSPCGTVPGQSGRFKIRYRRCVGDPRTRICNYGTCRDPCDGSRLERDECYVPLCCAPPVTTAWTGWETCTGNPLISRRRRTCQADPTKKTAPVCRTGDDCKNTEEEKPCVCKPNSWEDWGPWRPCEPGQYTTRVRRCRESDTNSPECPPQGVLYCAGKKTDKKQCPCVPSQWSPWMEWEQCNSEKFKRDLDTGEVCGEGTGCRNRTRVCQAGTCPVKVISEWSPWERCRNGPTGSISTRRRYCRSNPLKPRNATDCRTGYDCQPHQLQEQKRCRCDMPQWENWQPWVNCNEYQPTRTRTRSCRMPRGNSRECGTPTVCLGQKTEVVPCLCDWGSWLSWTSCDNRRVQTRTRRCLKTGSPRDCGSPSGCRGRGTDYRTCRQCEWNSWYEWDNCDFRLPQPMRKRFRVCVGRTEICGGCTGPSNEAQACVCNKARLGNWGGWDMCRMNSAGRYVRTRTRICISASNPDYCKQAPRNWTTCREPLTQEGNNVNVKQRPFILSASYPLKYSKPFTWIHRQAIT
ncbi:SCO-spondin-like [Elysia marginata]|uniref:SCO-spondin-like n=1 Tax=Elysia marginata TaxID=1093978 RepID=A0AAV4JVY1_9GAST|nr:SCO-spondin-like [Elysia marginata]